MASPPVVVEIVDHRLLVEQVPSTLGSLRPCEQVINCGAISTHGLFASPRALQLTQPCVAFTRYQARGTL